MLREVRRHGRRVRRDPLPHRHDPLPVLRGHAPSKTLTTLHGRLDLKDLAGVYRRWPQFPLVSISDDQRRPLPLRQLGRRRCSTACPPSLYRVQPTIRQGYLAFLGRISPEKRPDRAIEIAKRLGMPLKIAAKVDAADRVYFADEIEPLMDDPLIEFIGEIGDAAEVGLPGRRRRPAVPDRLARAVRPGDDRGHGLRHAGDRLRLRLGRRRSSRTA